MGKTKDGDEVRKDNKGRKLRQGEYQSSNGRYSYSYIEGGKRKYVYSWRLTFSDKMPNGKRDDKCLREKIEEIQRRSLKYLIMDANTITLNQMFDTYLANKLYKGKALMASTKENYKGMYNLHIRDTVLGNTPVVSIRKETIVVSFKELLTEDGLSYGSIVFFKKLLTAVFNMAIDNRIIEYNPMVRVMNEIEGSQRVVEALTQNQQRELLKYLKNNDITMYNWCVVLLDTMLRFGEFAGLTKSDIDFEQNVIHISHQLRYAKDENGQNPRLRISNPKNKKERIVPMTGRVRSILKDICNDETKVSDVVIDGYTDFLFSMNGKPLHHTDLYLSLKRIQDKYNKTSSYPIDYLAPHIFRHTGTTRAIEAGVDRGVLKEILGHATYQYIDLVYDSVQDGRKQKAIKDFGDYCNQIGNDE